MKKTPMQQVKDRFGSKDKLVDELLSMLKRPAESTKDQFRNRLKAQSNYKLMVLLEREKTLKDKYGTREKLVDALLKNRMGKNQKEDKGYRRRLEKLTNGQLLDLARRKKV